MKIYGELIPKFIYHFVDGRSVRPSVGRLVGRSMDDFAGQYDKRVKVTLRMKRI